MYNIHVAMHFVAIHIFLFLPNIHIILYFFCQIQLMLGVGVCACMGVSE